MQICTDEIRFTHRFRHDDSSYCRLSSKIPLGSFGFSLKHSTKLCFLLSLASVNAIKDGKISNYLRKRRKLFASDGFFFGFDVLQLFFLAYFECIGISFAFCLLFTSTRFILFGGFLRVDAKNLTTEQALATVSFFLPCLGLFFWGVLDKRSRAIGKFDDSTGHEQRLIKNAECSESHNRVGQRERERRREMTMITENPLSSTCNAG
jgi:hypothetical protein